MPAPTINLTTSILGYGQWESWLYQPWATGLDTSTPPQAASSDNFETQKPLAVVATTAALAANSYSNGTSGVGATLTASGNGVLTIDGYATTLGDVILVKNEATASHNGLYTVTTEGTASVPYALTRSTSMDTAAKFSGFVVISTGTANGSTIWLCPPTAITVGTTAVTFYQWKNVWAASSLPPGMSINPANGALSGQVSVAGVYVVGLRVSNDSGATWSTSVNLTIGIDPRAFAARSGADVFIEVGNGTVSNTSGGGATSFIGPIVTAKQEDDLLLYVHFTRNGTALDLGDLTALQFAIKEFDPDNVLVLGGDSEESTNFGKSGSGSDVVYILYVKFDGDALKGALSSYETDSGTFFEGFGEISWVEPNATGIGPDNLRRSTATFPVRITKGIVPST